MYEAVQEGSAEGFELMEDEAEERADAVAGFLGLERVGVLVCHPPRAEGCLLTGAEVIFAAQENLAVGADRPFIVVRATVNEEVTAVFTRLRGGATTALATLASADSTSPAVPSVLLAFRAVPSLRATRSPTSA